MRLRVVLAGIVLPLLVCGALWLVLPTGSEAQDAGRAASLQKKIEITRGKIGRRKGTERVLASDIAEWTRKIRRLEGTISRLRARQNRLQADLDKRRAELIKTQERLREERARLARLRVKLAEGRRILAKRLVELYQSDRPDLITVIFNSDGFADLLERGEFIQRIQEQDNNILNIVRKAKAEAEESAERLAKLEARQQRLAAIVMERRDQVARNKERLIGTRVGYERTRAGKQRALEKTRASRRELEKHLKELIAESNRVQARLQGIPAGPIRGGSGRFIWPINGVLTSPFCESRSWESCHPGIDIAAPTGTPIRAADGGRVAIAGWTGGYGQYTCIQHTASLSTCYAHQSAIRVRVGQQVAKGQIIGLVGSTGFSTGPHLHFEVRINGAVQNPLAYL
jgi:murein DD-endopeptidase MepM/ murein hydrolase activator NlpD